MTITELQQLQDLKRKDAQRMPSGMMGIEQGLLIAATETVILMAEICIELKRGNEK